MPSQRTLFISSDRLPDWVDRFVSTHRGVAAPEHGHGTCRESDEGLLVETGDGATALLRAPWPVDGRPGRGANAVERLAALAGQSRTVGVALIRRSGFAVGVCRDGKVVTSATGAGSRQASSRRSAHHDRLLVDSAAAALRDVLRAAASQGAPVQYLALGGDRPLCAILLRHTSMAAWTSLPRLEFVDLPDPKAATLQRAAVMVASVRTTVTEPG